MKKKYIYKFLENRKNVKIDAIEFLTRFSTRMSFARNKFYISINRGRQLFQTKEEIEIIWNGLL